MLIENSKLIYYILSMIVCTKTSPNKETIMPDSKSTLDIDFTYLIIQVLRLDNSNGNNSDIGKYNNVSVLFKKLYNRFLENLDVYKEKYNREMMTSAYLKRKYNEFKKHFIGAYHVLNEKQISILENFVVDVRCLFSQSFCATHYNINKKQELLDNFEIRSTYYKASFLQLEAMRNESKSSDCLVIVTKLLQTISRNNIDEVLNTNYDRIYRNTNNLRVLLTIDIEKTIVAKITELFRSYNTYFLKSNEFNKITKRLFSFLSDVEDIEKKNGFYESTAKPTDVHVVGNYIRYRVNLFYDTRSEINIDKEAFIAFLIEVGRHLLAKFIILINFVHRENMRKECAKEGNLELLHYLDYFRIINQQCFPF